jgi:hypothetical protein
MGATDKRQGLFAADDKYITPFSQIGLWPVEIIKFSVRLTTITAWSDGCVCLFMAQ